MLDNQINNQNLINFCNETLDISGKIALAHFRDIRDMTIKVDESPVTLADKQIEQVIRRETVSYTHLTLPTKLTG